MKRIALTALAVLCCTMTTLSAAPRKPKATKTVVYQTTLDCEKCAKKITENVSFEKGVKDLKVDVPTKQVTVTFDAARTDTLTLRKAINKLGYKAQVVSFE